MWAAVVVDARSVLSVSHWERIDGGLLCAATSGVPPAMLHARTFEDDVLSCGRSGPRLRERAVIMKMEVAGRILRGSSRHAGDSGGGARFGVWTVGRCGVGGSGRALVENAGRQVCPGHGDVVS